MTYESGSKVVASDFNTFLGGNGTSAYASSVAATNCIGALYGVGYGDRGYGQSAITQNAVVGQTDKITATQWANLRNMMEVLSNHQGTSVPLLPPSSVFSTSNKITAHESSAPTSDAYDINGYLATLDTNRFNTNGGASMTLTTNAHTSTRATAWGAGSAASIVTEIDVAFGSNDEARYFFNSGGELRLLGSQPTASTAQDGAWSYILGIRVGIITFSANNTTHSGNAGTSSAIGYYQLTNVYQTIYSGTNLGNGAYGANDVLVEARYSAGGTTNGAKGSRIRFRVTYSDQYNGGSDEVSASTSVSLSHLRATSILTGINAPVYSTVTAF